MIQAAHQDGDEKQSLLGQPPAQQDSPIAYSVREVSSSSSSPPKPLLSAGNATNYSQRVKGMSDHETDSEMQWQEWRVELRARKVR